MLPFLRRLCTTPASPWYSQMSTGSVESTINHGLSKRMVTQQQLQWTPEDAHVLLQGRTQVLIDDWDGAFQAW